MESKAQSMMPKNKAEYQEFADCLGEHCMKFNSFIGYKDFVRDLIIELCDPLPADKVNDIYNHLSRFSQSRAKEEKAGKVQFRFQEKDANAESDDSSDGQSNLYDDFM